MTESLLTIHDVTRILRVSRRTIYNWMDAGILDPLRINRTLRFRSQDIEALTKAKPGDTPIRKKILVIDDDVLVRESLKLLLQREGFEVMLAAGCRDALDILMSESADLIICDMRMPEANGIETLMAIRQARPKAPKRHIPEILLTAYDDLKVRQEAAHLGVQSFVLKPFELPLFLQELRRHLK